MGIDWARMETRMDCSEIGPGRCDRRLHLRIGARSEI